MYAVVGTGALGGYYGSRLVQSGADVHFLCHRDGPWVREKGLLVESVDRSILHARVHAYDRVEDLPPCDVVIVALKTTSNHLLPDVLPPIVKPGGVVLVMQNGWEVERDAARAVPGAIILGGLCFLCANKPGPGFIRHLDYGDVLLGWCEETGNRTDASRWMNRIAAGLNDAHVKADIVEDLRLARWKKLVWNIPYNGLSVMHRTTTDVLMARPRHRARVEALMREVQQLAIACGSTVDDAFVTKMLDDTIRMKPYKTSMLLDYEAGRPLEVEAMYERPLLAGEAAGACAPGIRELYEQLKDVEPSTRSIDNSARVL